MAVGARRGMSPLSWPSAVTVCWDWATNRATTAKARASRTGRTARSRAWSSRLGLPGSRWKGPEPERGYLRNSRRGRGQSHGRSPGRRPILELQLGYPPLILPPNSEIRMPFKVISHFQFKPGKADEELLRSGEVLSHLRTQPGFLSYEVVRTGQDRIAVIQAWESEDRFSDAMVSQAGRAASQPATSDRRVPRGPRRRGCAVELRRPRGRDGSRLAAAGDGQPLRGLDRRDDEIAVELPHRLRRPPIFSTRSTSSGTPMKRPLS